MGRHCGGLLSADQGGHEIVKCGTGADFVISMRGRGADFSVREQLPRHAFSQYEEFHGFAERHLAIVENDVFLAPWLVELRFDGVERNLLGKPWGKENVILYYGEVP